MKIECKNVQAWIDKKQILHGVDITLESGEIHAMMGKNGSGKSTFANVLFGNPNYEVSGSILVDGEDIIELEPHERAAKGLFLAFQYPIAIPGITVGRFLKRVHDTLYPDDAKRKKSFIQRLRDSMDFMRIDRQFINRYLNDGFSGGEKKRMEILQMLVLNPRFAVLDETDSGLDIDALKIVAKGVNALYGDDFGALIITHYQRILTYITPQKVHIMYKGRIVHKGGPELVEHLERDGYDWIEREFGVSHAAS